eukprot:gene57-61_t
MILPPFPFPKQWEDVAKIQATTNEFNWLVPSYYYYYDQNYEVKDPLPEETEIKLHEEDEAEEFEIELNEEWAERLAGTVERLKRKSKASKVPRKSSKNKRQRRRKTTNTNSSSSTSQTTD